MNPHVVLRIVTKILVPPIILFALYVQFHGDYGPGGGFQAGVILAVAFILYGLVFGLDAAKQVAPPGVIQFLMAFGVMLYAGVGFTTVFLGAAYLDYDVLEPGYGQTSEEHGVAPATLSPIARAFAADTANEHGSDDAENDEHHDEHHAGQHYGILAVELGVGITVASVMISLFYGFSGRSVEIRDEDW